MTIIARITRNNASLKVKVDNVFTTPDGRKLASVTATSGRPFTRWTHGGWIESDTENIPVSLLHDVHQEPETEKPSLLTLALDQAKEQWYSGEVVWIWRNNGNGAYLKNESGFVSLHLTGRRPSCPVFYLDVEGWQTSRVVEADYQKWVKRVSEVRS